MKRSTVVAAVVLFLLAGYAYWLQHNAARDERIETVFDVETDAIARVEIRRYVDDGEDGVIIAQEDGTWRVVSPINALADASEVELVLENLATMAFERAIPIEAATDRGAFGIETPRLEVRFFTADGAEHGLRFGKDTLTPANQYAERIDDSTCSSSPPSSRITWERPRGTFGTKPSSTCAKTSPQSTSPCAAPMTGSCSSARAPIGW